MSSLQHEQVLLNEAFTQENLHDSHVFFHYLDRVYQANLAKMTLGISPAALRNVYFIWLSQLMQAPGRVLELLWFVPLHLREFIANVVELEQPAKGRDVRFQSEHWQEMPWRGFAELFLLTEKWWECATHQVPGVPVHAERVMSFTVRQGLDAISPANFIGTNPDLFYETLRSGGKNLVRGTQLAFKDMFERVWGLPPSGVEHFIPGEAVAVTPGRVIFSNHLIELIQYEAQTEHVYQEPILIIPAWIMKFYILDLSPNNSLVKWLVSQGHTVYMISWRNPTKEDRDLSFDDYYRLGAMAAIDVVSKRHLRRKINLMGYCLGGTLAMITAAAMSREDDHRLNSLTLLAAQGDFTEAGELMLYINKSELSFLENMMWDQGYLDTKQMAGSFQMLRTYDLIWSKMIQDYMHGGERGMIDLLAWNADATRMPYKMHSEYLEKLFMNNDFAAGRFTVEGKPVVAADIHVPTFVVSTEKDHVAPWRSVYKIHLMLNGDVTFILTSGGHNAGIVSEPGHPGRFYRAHKRLRRAHFLSPDQWLNVAKKIDGSWWEAWHAWLLEQDKPKQMLAPTVDASLPAAPGHYVFQK